MWEDHILQMYIVFVEQVMMKEMKRQDNLINKLNSGMHHDVTNANHEEGNYS